MIQYISREDAAFELLKILTHFKDKKNVLIIALPRGGVVLGAILAKHLHLPLDILAPRKIGAMDQKELAIGAICEGELFLMKGFESFYTPSYLEKTIQLEKEEEKRRLSLYRFGKKELDLEKKHILLVDDGIATGATMVAAILALRKRKVQAISIAAPVASIESAEELKPRVEELYILQTSSNFIAISQFYRSFPQVEDQRVIELLKEVNK